MSNDIAVYTDGACSNNGAASAKAGIGVFFGANDPRNVSRRISGKQTNNRAELTAIITVADVLKEHIQCGGKVTIYSDSQYAIRCCTSYGEKLCKAGWAKKVPNAELVKLAYLLYEGKSNVDFVYVRAHTGLHDPHSVGNDGADKLANAAIGEQSCPYSSERRTVTPSRQYLNVPYSEKEDAKEYGARWDPAKKKWYVGRDSRHLSAVLTRWG